MARYVLLLDDSRYGPAGTIIAEANDDYAAWLQRDRPGLLAPAPLEDAERAMSTPPQDRKVTAPRRKRDRQGDPGDQGPITRADFRATRS